MLLAIDTASQMLSLALFDGQSILAEQTLLSQNQHTVQLAAQIQGLLSAFDTPALTAIAVSQGAGSYSGLRVGFGVAKGLATARQIPVIPIPTLDIVAAATPYFAGGLIATIQAGRRRVVACPYSWQVERWQRSGDATNTTWAELLATIDTPTLINGELGDEVLAHTDKRIQVCSPAWQLRRAGFLALLGWQHLLDGAYPPDIAAANPIYLKEPS